MLLSFSFTYELDKTCVHNSSSEEEETVLAQIMYRSHLHSLIEIIFGDLRDGNCSFSLTIWNKTGM